MSAKTLYENTARTIKVIAHEPIGSYKDDSNTLNQDPLYSRLLGKSTDE